MVSAKQREELIDAACAAREQAYAPYSRYKVGAALLADDGRIFSGANVENVSYGLTICAERTAVFTAATAGVRKILAVAVCTDNAGSPCGACRQVMHEFAGDIPVWLVDGERNVRETSLGTLLPDHFSREYLPPVE
jgi:cytidine deaminase